jgi:hypothetical protein
MNSPHLITALKRSDGYEEDTGLTKEVILDNKSFHVAIYLIL